MKVVEMDRRTQLSEMTAGLVLLLAAVHVALFFLVVHSDEKLSALLLALAVVYAVCVLLLDVMAWRCPGEADLRLRFHFALAASAVAALWLLWGEQWLRSCGDTLKLLASLAAAPYLALVSSGYEGLSRSLSQQAGTACQIVILVVCLGHLAYYGYLRRKAAKEA